MADSSAISDNGPATARWQLAQLESLTGHGSWIMDLTDRTVHFSEAMRRMLGVAAITSLDEAPYQFRFRPGEREKVRDAVWTAIGMGGTFSTVAACFIDPELRVERVFVWHGAAYRDRSGRVTHAMGTVRDITDQLRDRAELAFLADHDPLTGLANRGRFTAWLAAATSQGRSAFLLLLDVDRFNDVTNLGGHSVGDQVLRRVAATVAEQMRPDTQLGRVGGDEFAVLVPGAAAADATAVAEGLRQAVEASRPGSRAQRVTISIGVAELEPGTDPETALARADLAMHAAKAAGRNRVLIFTDDLLRVAARRVSLLERVESALGTDRMELDAQPIVDLATGATVRHEVLIRLRDGRTPETGPAEFLPVVERTDLMRELDRWVLIQVVDTLATPAARAADLRLDANLSALSLADDRFGVWVLELLAARNVEPGRLGLEITETAALDSLVAARSLVARLTAAGCGFALDDFGAGYGSFAYLKTLPFTSVKIDGQFIRHLDRDPVDRAMVAGVVAVARLRGMRTVAEQVSHPGLLAPLQALRVDRVQGYHLGRPRRLTELLATL